MHVKLSACLMTLFQLRCIIAPMRVLEWVYIHTWSKRAVAYFEALPGDAVGNRERGTYVWQATARPHSKCTE
jgi:hypothetical protein